MFTLFTRVLQRSGVAVAGLGLLLVVSLASLWAGDTPPADAGFPGANGYLAVARGAVRDIWLVNPDGSGEFNVTNSTGDEYAPAWSPTGTTVAYSGNADGDYDIYVLSGSTITNLTPFNLTAEKEPAYSNTGGQIAFVSDRDGNDEIYVMNADGSGQTRCTHDPGKDAAPRLSPESDLIAFQSDRDGDNEIYLMSLADCGAPPVDPPPVIQLTHNTFDDGAPDWAPRGPLLAFHSNRSGNYDIYTHNYLSLGGAPIADRQITTSPKDDLEPAWSPDGTLIAYQNGTVPGSFEIYLIDSDGSSAPVQVTTNAEDDGGADWQPLDEDGDGIPATIDNCRFVFNPGQEDADGDGVGDACDNCPQTPNPGRPTPTPTAWVTPATTARRHRTPLRRIATATAWATLATTAHRLRTRGRPTPTLTAWVTPAITARRHRTPLRRIPTATAWATTATTARSPRTRISSTPTATASAMPAITAQTVRYRRGATCS